VGARETTKSHPAAIHGFEAMMNDHSDDFELGNRMAARGFRIALMDQPVQMVYPRSSMREFFKLESQTQPTEFVRRHLTYSGYAIVIIAVD